MSKKVDGKRVRGSDPVGLMMYLFGPGRHNEHTDPHIVTAAAALGVADGHRYKDVRDVIALGHDVNAPHVMFGTEFPGGHIWHMSLANPNGDRVLSDEEWAQIARESMATLRFDDSSGRPPCRWVAVRHGVSIEGNDHIHLAVDLIREDGTRASIWNDWEVMSRLAATFERRYGLTVVDGRARSAGLPSVTRAEMEIAARSDPVRGETVQSARPGRTVTARASTARARLARVVRAAATAAAGEAEFVRRLRAGGALPRPRYAPGGTQDVVGYSVALRPGRGGSPRWYGGGSLAPDLTLPRLRERWNDTSETRREALSAWTGHAGQKPGREAQVYHARAWDEAAQVAARVVAELALVPDDDEAAWAEVASDAAGVFAALSSRVESDRPGPLARAADTLAYSAQRHPRPAPPRSRPGRDLRGVAMVALQAGPIGRTAVGDMLLVRQMTRVMQHVHDAHVAKGEALQAARLATVARDELAALHQRLGPAGLSRDATTKPPARPPQRGGPELGR